MTTVYDVYDVTNESKEWFKIRFIWREHAIKWISIQESGKEYIIKEVFCL